MYTYELKDYISGNFPFSIKNTAVVADCPVHIHDYLELVIVSGEAEYILLRMKNIPLKLGMSLSRPRKTGMDIKIPKISMLST